MDEESMESYETSPVLTRGEMAYLMKMKGLSLSDIAAELHIGVSTVNELITNRFRVEAENMTSEDRIAVLAMERDRLNFYLAKLWPSIEYGDVKAISLALGVHDRIMKAHYFDRPDSDTQAQQILVVGGEEEDYIAALKTSVEK